MIGENVVAMFDTILNTIQGGINALFPVCNKMVPTTSLRPPQAPMYKNMNIHNTRNPEWPKVTSTGTWNAMVIKAYTRDSTR